MCGEEDKKTEEYSGTAGNESGQYPFVLYNGAVLRHKTTAKPIIFFFLFDYNN